jgi:hypothetical protein
LLWIWARTVRSPDPAAKGARDPGTVTVATATTMALVIMDIIQATPPATTPASTTALVIMDIIRATPPATTRRPTGYGYGGYGNDYGASYYGYNSGYGYDQGYALGGVYVPSCSYVGGPKAAIWRCR